MAENSGANPATFGKAAVLAYLAAAQAALTGDEPDIEEALTQIKASQVVIAMFANEIKERDATDVANEIHDGVAIINGRAFTVKEFLPEYENIGTGRPTILKSATIKVRWR